MPTKNTSVKAKAAPKIPADLQKRISAVRTLQKQLENHPELIKYVSLRGNHWPIVEGMLKARRAK